MKKYFYFLSLILLLTSTQSCVKDISISQLDHLVLTPVFDFDFIYSKKDAADFNQTNQAISVVIPELIERDTTDLAIFSNNLTGDIQQIDFTFIVDNTIPHDFEMEFKYLTTDNQIVNNPIIINATRGNGEDLPAVRSITIDILDKTEINNLSNATKVVSTIKGNNINSDAKGYLKLQSKATYYIKKEL